MSLWGRRFALLSLVSVVLAPAFAAKQRINDFPTLDRVEYVESCVMNYPAKPRHEMIYKCSCMLDEIAKEISYRQYVDMSTAFNASTIAGDRGAIREAKSVQKMTKRFRELQAKAKKTCLIE